MNYEFILALDPSGSYREGKGTTGWSIYDCNKKNFSLIGDIKATKFKDMEAYWDAHIELINKYYKRYGNRMIVVIEDYLLYASKAEEQINSRMETSKLIGVMQHFCWFNDIPYWMQTASEVKSRWTDEILVHKKLLSSKGRSYMLTNGSKELVHKHIRDSLRHAIHFATFKNNRR